METTNKLGPDDFIDPIRYEKFNEIETLKKAIRDWSAHPKDYTHRRFAKIDLYRRTFETTNVLEELLDPRSEYIYLIGTWGTIQITDSRLSEWIKLEKEQMILENFHLRTKIEF